MSSSLAGMDGAKPFKQLTNLLVYFEPDDSGVFPASPFDILAKGKAVLYLYDCVKHLGYPYQVRNATELTCVMEALFLHPDIAGGNARVFTIHYNSVLGRLSRWHTIRTGRQTMPAPLQPGAAVDLVEAINAPAVLSARDRYSFRLNDYVELLGLSSDCPGDKTACQLLDIINRYV